ncbi:MAG: DUF4129 domain-containing transglutaminase family protein [Acidimicrobiales bacterium]
MALVAALAVALAAVGAALATGGHQLGPVSITPAVYGLALVPGVVAVALGRRPSLGKRVGGSGAGAGATAGPATMRKLPYAAVSLLLLVVAVKRVPESMAAGITVGAALSVICYSFWWPLPLFVRVSVAVAALSLARPGADVGSHVPELLFMATAAAIALVASTRLDTATDPVLGGMRSPPRGRRVAVEAAFVLLAVLLGAALASRLDDQQPSPSESQVGADPRERQPAPLAYQDVLDPDEAARSRRGGDPDEVLLKVGTDRPGVLRAVTFDEWDGRRWRRSAALDGGRVFDDRGGVPVSGSGRPGPPDTFSRQRIRVEAPYASVAVGTPEVFYYDLPVGGRPFPDGTVELVPALGKGAVYVAQTGRSNVTVDDLRATDAVALTAGGARRFGAGGPEEGEPLENANFTADPPLSDRARALAERVTAGAPTDYDKVAALTAYLDASVAVGDDVAPLPAGADPVDVVLFGSGPSSPERLATTLALLTRAVGLPARMATGFLPGRRPFFGGDFVVRAGDAHAWVEVPFLGVGWQRFDPTGRIAMAEQQDSLWSRLRRAWERFWPVILVVVAVLGAFVVHRVVRWRRRLAATPWATRYFARLVRVGAKRGRPRRPAETPAEYTAALADGPLADERLVEVGRLVTAAAWSGREPAGASRAWAEQVLDEAARATRSRRTRTRSGTSAST